MATITIPDDTFKRLETRAAAIGTTVDELVVPLLNQVVPLEPEQRDRQQAFEKLIELIHTQTPQDAANHLLDVSRDAIYEERLRSQL